MAAGNGVDLGTVVSMLSNITTQVGSLTTQVGSLTTQVAGLTIQVASLTVQVASLTSRMDRVETSLGEFRQETRAEFASLRETVDFYHQSVVGHGMAMSDHETRIERVENSLGLPHTSQ